MVRIHTGQLNIGKRLSKNSNVLFLDITVKSGIDLIERSLAPTWDIVHASKAGGASKDYLLKYLPLVDHNLDDMVIDTSFKWIFHKSGPYTDVVLGCYCKFGKFCHRHAAAKKLASIYGAKYCGEINSESVTSTDVAITTLFRVTNVERHDLNNLAHSLASIGEVHVLPPQVYQPGDGANFSASYERELPRILVQDKINLDFSDSVKHAYPLIYELSRRNILPVLSKQINNVSTLCGPLPTDIEGIRSLVTKSLIRKHISIDKWILDLDYEAVYDVEFDEVCAIIEKEQVDN